MVRTIFVTALLTVLSSGLPWHNVVLAADESVEAEPALLDELSLGDLLTMEITTGSFLELDLMKSPLSMTIITREMVRASGARHMSELLEIYVPGFIYNMNKYYGTVWAMRGVANDRNTKVIYCVNGHKMNTQARDGFQGETVLGLLGDIERVEVLRGPAGLVYGSGAIAGIINVVTRKGEGNKSTATVTAGGDGSKSIEGNLYGNPVEGISFAATGGYKQSDGFPLSATRVYSRAGTTPNSLGVPSDGRYGSTDGNWKLAADVTANRFNFYMRGTRQKETTASYFCLAPWAELVFPTLPVDSAKYWRSREIDGNRYVSPTDPFWGGRNNWRNSMKLYLSDNFMSEASYNFPLGDNELKTKLSYDLNTTSILEEQLEHYYTDRQYPNGRVIETFGEKRYLANATFLLKSITNLQAAFGIEDRIDEIGYSMNGKDEQLWVAKHYIVSKINYNTFSLFGEGFYDINEYISAQAGVRLDIHTRATFASPKLAAVYRPNENHSIKLIYQSAANNGSADNYEYNRKHVNDQGDILTKPTFVSWIDRPTDTSSLVQPAELSEMHSLKPERVHSVEGTYVGKLLEGLTIEPSLSWNLVSNLHVWDQTLFRVVNCGQYQFANADLAVNYTNKYFKAGINHTFQRPVRTNIDEQNITFKLYQLKKDSVVNGDTIYGTVGSINSNGDTMWSPIAEKTLNYEVNLVKRAVTYDGLSFLNLPTNMTKLFLMITPFDWVSINANLRLIWGLPGRGPVIQSTENGVNSNNIADTGNYFGYYDEKDAANFKDYFMTQVSKKWNASLSFFLPANIEASFYIYNILGTDRHDFTNIEADRNTVNTLRAEQMYDYGNRDLYSTDQRTFGITFTKSF
ncbi:MAG: TonB-dependent receptor plug domain-containing protein [Chitinispirillaceae bacterium]|nr:TonB-dependent receptor plug domain-containing protein [Chitinispirillaceae bacterium]